MQREIVSTAKYMLNSAFSNLFSGIVWRIKLDEENKLIAVETRDPDSGIPEFSVIYYPTGQRRIDQLRYGDRWWTIAGIQKNHLLLQALHEHGPQAAGLVAIHCDTGQPAWEAFQYRLLSLTTNGALVNHRVLSGSTGDLLEITSGKVIASGLRMSDVNHPAVSVVIPQPYERQAPDWFSMYVTEGPFFYTPYRDADIWAFHEPDNSGGYAVRLIILSGESVLHNGVLLEKLPKILLEPFFIVDDQLFCITHNNRGIASYFILTERNNEH